MKPTYTKKLLFIRNSNLTECSLFEFAKSGSPRHGIGDLAHGLTKARNELEILKKQSEPQSLCLVDRLERIIPGEDGNPASGIRKSNVKSI